MRLFCWYCHSSVTSELPEDSVFRAIAVCPECLEKSSENTNHPANFNRGPFLNSKVWSTADIKRQGDKFEHMGRVWQCIAEDQNVKPGILCIARGYTTGENNEQGWKASIAGFDHLSKNRWLCGNGRVWICVAVEV